MSLAPRVRLPWDCLALVFKECDKATLAVLGRVSLDVLAVTATMLYQDVEIDSLAGLRSLFCKRTHTTTGHVSRVDAFLSLGAVRSLSVEIALPLAPREAPHLDLSLSRSPFATTLSLDFLRLVIPRHKRDPDPLFGLLYDHLFPLLDPAQVSYTLTCDRDPRLWTESDKADVLTGWIRIELLELKGGVPYTYAEHELCRLFGLPPARSDHRRVVKLHLTSFGEDYAAQVLLESLIDVDSLLNLDAMQPGSVVFVVDPDQDGDNIELEARAAIEAFNIPQKWRSIFVVGRA